MRDKYLKSSSLGNTIIQVFINQERFIRIQKRIKNMNETAENPRIKERLFINRLEQQTLSVCQLILESMERKIENLRNGYLLCHSKKRFLTKQAKETLPQIPTLLLHITNWIRNWCSPANVEMITLHYKIN